MRFVHITDPHLTTPPPRGSLAGRSHFGKRYLGYASWWRKRRHSLKRAWLDELVAEILTLEPDWLTITGDLTQIGTEEELTEARAWLDDLDVSQRILLVPGNHDTYGGDSWGNLQRIWSPYLPEEGFPAVTRTGQVAFFSLSTAVPTMPLSAGGELGSPQLEALERSFEGHEDAFRILLLHHPPLPGMIQPRKRLRDAAALQKVLDRRSVDLVLYGHQHRNRSADRGGMKLFCTAPASAEAASFRVFDLESSGTNVEVTASLRCRTEKGFSCCRNRGVVRESTLDLMQVSGPVTGPESPARGSPGWVP